jgi:hypothetical protein
VNGRPGQVAPLWAPLKRRRPAGRACTLDRGGIPRLRRDRRLSLGVNRWSVKVARAAVGARHAGAVLGLGAAVALSRTLARLHGVEPTDTTVYALVSCLLLAVVLLAGHLPPPARPPGST